MAFWLDKLFHLVSHGALLCLLYWIGFRLPGILRAPIEASPKLVQGEFVHVLHGRNRADQINELNIEWQGTW